MTKPLSGNENRHLQPGGIAQDDVLQTLGSVFQKEFGQPEVLVELPAGIARKWLKGQAGKNN